MFVALLLCFTLSETAFAQKSGDRGVEAPVPWPPAPDPVPTVQPIPTLPPANARYKIPVIANVVVPPIAHGPVSEAANEKPAVEELRAALKREVPNLLTVSPSGQSRLLSLAQAQLRASETSFIERPQLMLVVDRNPSVQEIWIVVARANAAWDVLGGTRVSTGTTGRFDHYITPVGVFQNTADILGYRAEGTYNEYHIRGNGIKGMRVWDFGWHWAAKGWRGDRERGQIRLEMHATDPDTLVHQIGHTASSGCIRIPDALNRFIDRHGVIDADYERAAVDDIRFRALLLPDRVPSPLAGNTVIVVDSSGAA
jgi:hypothetical protein